MRNQDEVEGFECKGWERLKVLRQVEEGRIQQVEATRRAGVADHRVALATAFAQGGNGDSASLRGRGCQPQDHPEARQKRAITELRQPRYAGFGPTLASEHLARAGLVASRETLRQWMVSQPGCGRCADAERGADRVWRRGGAAAGARVVMMNHLADFAVLT